VDSGISFIRNVCCSSIVFLREGWKFSKMSVHNDFQKIILEFSVFVFLFPIMVSFILPEWSSGIYKKVKCDQ
jgi:hypothetical protein